MNTRAELAAAAAVLRDRINHDHMLAGVTIVDPATTWIDPTVELEPDSTIQPFTVLRGRTRVAARRRGRPARGRRRRGRSARARWSAPSVTFAPERCSETGAKAGTFVEIKNSRIGEGAKVPHQSYIGDADIGEGTNIGAGNITANFSHQPGEPKGRTTIGRNVRTGVHNAFVAPVEIGDDAWIGAGSVITKDVPPGSLAVGRAAAGEQGGLRATKAGAGAMSEATLPGLETVEPVLPMSGARPLDRARAAEAADGLLRPLAPRAG